MTCSMQTASVSDMENSVLLKSLVACQFSSWYEMFSNLNKCHDSMLREKNIYARNSVTIKSVIIKNLPEEFISYLLCDGLSLPKSANRVSSFMTEYDADYDSRSIDGNEMNTEPQEPGNEDTEHLAEPYDLSSLTDEIRHGIECLDGSVLPKLNWSAPRDAAWINNGTLRCETPGDVYLLLKSSDFCLHDILQMRHDFGTTEDKTVVKHELILRKWCNLSPSSEFRCFVANHILVGVSQRRSYECYPHLNCDQTKIKSVICDFFECFIKYNFASGDIPDYVLDVYVDKTDRCWLIDFNVWEQQTDSLLFTWDELTTMKDTVAKYFVAIDGVADHKMRTIQTELRIVQDENMVISDPLSCYKVPIDTVNLASDSHQFQEFMRLCEKPSSRFQDETSE